MAAEPASEPSRDEAQPAVEGLREAGPAKPAWARRRTLLIVAGIAAVVVLGVLLYLLVNAGKEETDDALIDADVVPLAPRVAGQVASVPVVENQSLRSGELILQLDGRDYQARVDQASAELESARAQAAATEAEVAVAEAAARGSLSQAEASLLGSSRSVASARAQLEEARGSLVSREADLKLAELNLARTRQLQRARAIAQQQLDQAQAQRDMARAAREVARASVAAAEEQLRRTQAQVGESEGRVAVSRPVESSIAAARASAAYQRAREKSAEAALALSRLSLEWTRLVAPGDGVVSGLTSHPGAYLTVGQTVGEFVPEKKYVTANFKETQLERMRPGQAADVEVDTYGRTLHGKVESLSGSTGARFSLLPPDNASGNFVKIAQRVPVRISLDAVPPGMVLRAGQSVVVTVHVAK